MVGFGYGLFGNCYAVVGLRLRLQVVSYLLRLEKFYSSRNCNIRFLRNSILRAICFYKIVDRIVDRVYFWKDILSLR